LFINLIYELIVSGFMRCVSSLMNAARSSHEQEM